MRFEKRIRALEDAAFEDATILHFADGSSCEISGPRYHLLVLFGAVCRGDLTSEQSSQLDLIRESVAAEEPGGGRMIEVIQALMSPSVELADQA